MKETEKYLIADIGSTTTKVLFITDGEIISREEAKTTVEKPEEDVEVGLKRAVDLVSDGSGEDIEGAEFLFTSSAGGGLQVVAIGITSSYTATSARRLSENSGAIVIDTIALDDGRTQLERIQDLNRLKPDLILFAGGFEGGAVNQLVSLAELINLSEIHPKFETGKVPIIFCGNSDAHKFLMDILGDKFELKLVPNINPDENTENFTPARNEILNTFVEHVMASAPGYHRLCERTVSTPLPTPVAVERMLSLYSRNYDKKVFSFDMGGATTDYFSVDGENCERSVSANLGMTYSLPYVVESCGIDEIKSRLEGSFKDQDVLNFIGNRYIRPVTVSETGRELRIEEAIAHNIIAKGYQLHREVAVIEPDFIVASGGFVAHHPHKDRLKKILQKAISLPSETEVSVDDSFILPHLGVLSTVDEDLALRLFEKDVVIL